jgi:hypothetical protein
VLPICLTETLEMLRAQAICTASKCWWPSEHAVTKIPPLELIKNFDSLPDDAVVPDKVARIILNESERSFRRNSKLRKVSLGPQRNGRRVGDIRKLVRG